MLAPSTTVQTGEAQRGGTAIKLATKLIALVVAAVAALLIVDGCLEIRRERRLVTSDMSEYALLVGRSLRGPIADIWSERGMDRALELIEDVNREENAVTVRWVWLDGGESAGSAPAAAVSSIDDFGAEGKGAIVLEDSAAGARLVSYVPIDVPGDRTGALELSESLAKRDARTAVAIRRVSLLLGGLLAASAVTIFHLGVRLVGRPLAQLSAKAERVGAGDLSGPLELAGGGELADLATGLNRMCEQLSEAQVRIAAETAGKIQALEQLRHADRLRTVGRLASGIAHELGTPLNVVSGRAGLIGGGKLGPDQVTESAEIIRAQTDRMTQIIRQLLDFARRRSSEKTLVDIGHVAASTCELVAPAAKKQRVVLERSCDELKRPVAKGNESEIQQVISNLLMNAIQSMPAGGTARVEVGGARVTPPNADGDSPMPAVRVTVSDQGQGITEEDLPHVFEPFFTTKDVGSGTGLGLSIAYGIIQDHGGWIDVESEPGQGSRFTFYLPDDGS